jgi:hypothetical protein
MDPLLPNEEISNDFIQTKLAIKYLYNNLLLMFGKRIKKRLVFLVNKV